MYLRTNMNTHEEADRQA